MYTQQRADKDFDEPQVLRQRAGRWLRALREDLGMSQRDLANALQLEYYTFVSQLESGRGRVPPAQYATFAKALNVPLKVFVKTLMRFYDPVTYQALFDGEIDDSALPVPVPGDPIEGEKTRAQSPKRLEANLAAKGAADASAQLDVVELAARLKKLEEMLASKS